MLLTPISLQLLKIYLIKISLERTLLIIMILYLIYVRILDGLFCLCPTSSMEFFLHGITAMNYPLWHCLSTTSLWKQCTMQCIQCTPLLGTIYIAPGPLPICSRVALLWTLLSRALCICTTRINVRSCYKKMLWTRPRHQQQTHCILYIV